jgi:hypothetical protein
MTLLGITREFKPADVESGDELDVDGSHYLTAKEIAEAASLPIHLFRDQAERNRKCVPHLMLVGNLRFSLSAILEWEMANSLADFSKMVEVFERQGVSFVSVTQQFNTTTSMGRLMLNVLLSFAQFEREVTGERIRNKIAASKRKGKWVGGVPSLGYDVVNRKLVINDAEAEVVRRMFTDYPRVGSTTMFVQQLRHEGVTTKNLSVNKR